MTKRLKRNFVVTLTEGLKHIELSGQTARTLTALIEAGESGVTALEMSSWAIRISEYVRILRHDHGLNIETIREDHNGPAGPGWHGRYVMYSAVEQLLDDEAA